MVCEAGPGGGTARRGNNVSNESSLVPCVNFTERFSFGRASLNERKNVFGVTSFLGLSIIVLCLFPSAPLISQASLAITYVLHSNVTHAHAGVVVTGYIPEPYT